MRTGAPRRRRTLRDVADAVGVSVNTVSRALRGESGVSAESRETIRRAAERLGYVPNVHARSLVLGGPRTIGLVITNVSNPFYAELISAIEQRAAEEGYHIVLFLSEESTAREQAAAENVIRSGLDGVIVVPVQGETNPWPAVERAGIPLVVVNRRLDDLDVDTVATDNHAGAYAATSHVIAQGARSIVMLEEDLPITTIDQRIQGFRDALVDASLPLDDRQVIMVPTRRNDRAALPWQAGDAYRVTVDLLARGHRPDGCVVGNDYFALGLYRALRERGLRCPEDTLVVGFGDYPFAEFLEPPLSTVRLPAGEVGRAAVDRLMHRVNGAEPRSREVTLVPPELVTRRSTGS
ncbi:LacI family DNA-binding transcriptional regulator [Ruania alkalisoli]|uniref:LacI family DNA-binding transcriptional regulator n=1 Tax=Ruania alkalisoli TaxID=2779775 RepID=A0A7M1SYU9_9MICO|nr:LacI family DNA-binding transcriptional regulator [Ruania alkalisoli]